jgi:hypothetical protein
MVALHKDNTNKCKLRPIGIPSDVWRIPAKAIIHIHKSRFANYLLPFNYTFGINDGVDLVTLKKIAWEWKSIQPILKEKGTCQPVC